MKIGVCGKGGSGKSTVVALLAQGMKQKGRKVMVLDSDESNANLSWMLGFDRAPEPLMEFMGGKKKVQQKMLASFTRGDGEPVMSVWDLEHISSREIPSAHFVGNEDLKLVAAGKIHTSFEGCACPMGVVTREFLKKLRLEPGEVTLVDLEAGIEHFGRGVEGSVDVVISVVEPSLESIQLAARTVELSEASNADYKGAVLNKMSSPDQEHQVRAKLAELGVPVCGAIRFDPEIQSACLEGRPLNGSRALEDVRPLVEGLLG